MSNKIYFRNTPNYGNLYIDYIFHYDDQPILFSLKDSVNNFYLCVCYELYEYQKWFITKVDFKDLKKMNDNRITVLELFLKHNSILQAQRKRYVKNIDYKFEIAKEIDKDLLPEEGFYLDTNEEEQKEFNEFYAKEIQSINEFYFTIKEAFIQPIYIRKRIKLPQRRFFLEHKTSTIDYLFSINNELINQNSQKIGGDLNGI